MLRPNASAIISWVNGKRNVSSSVSPSGLNRVSSSRKKCASRSGAVRRPTVIRRSAITAASLANDQNSWAANCGWLSTNPARSGSGIESTTECVNVSIENNAVSKRQLLATAKSPGSSTLTIWR